MGDDQCADGRTSTGFSRSNVVPASGASENQSSAFSTSLMVRNHRTFRAGEEVQPDGLGVAAQRCAACRRIMISDGGANEKKMRL